MRLGPLGRHGAQCTNSYVTIAVCFVYVLAVLGLTIVGKVATEIRTFLLSRLLKRETCEHFCVRTELCRRTVNFFVIPGDSLY